mmetsp:Transcript_4615/g.5052  ORF Transcript_4615/g.5052 Transcript_4615/m.5052 type:complete len:211 (-) Transcript_4615:114-746(-)
MIIIFALLFSQLFLLTSSYSIDILPGQKECFIVMSSIGNPVTGSFEVIHPDAKFIEVAVTGPKGFLHYEKKPKKDKSGEEGDDEESSEGFFSFDAELNGEHTMCISNGDDSNNDGLSRLIAFNFRSAKEGEQDYQFVGLKSELADLKEGLDLLKDHQSYMNQREDVHKDTLESINTKVLMWTVLEAVVLIAMAVWQIVYIRSFFEVKRRL